MLKVKFDKDVLLYIKSKNGLIPKNTIGVYFLKFNDTVVYVGKSIDIQSRIKTHCSEKTKMFNDFYFIECSKNTLDSTEVSYIMLHDPVFNKRDSLTNGKSLGEFCESNGIHNTFECKKGRRPVSVSLDERIIEMINELVKARHCVNGMPCRNASHLIEMLILKDHAKFVKGK